MKDLSIRLENICVSFHSNEILHKIHFRLEEKQLVMLLGLNGSGKTTLLRVLLGFHKPNKGKVWYNDTCLEQLSVKERGKLVSYVPQFPQADVPYLVKEFLLLGITPYLGLFQTPKQKHRELVEQTLEKFHLSHLAEHSVSSLSGGERQLVYFARANIQNTSWMILDEPLASLDYLKQHEFMERLITYQKENMQGILLSVHDPNYALAYADTVLVLHHHQIIDVIHRSEKDFELHLTKQLNKIYRNHLHLVKQEWNHFYCWKEE